MNSAVSDFEKIRKDLRVNVRDTYGIQWSDTALDIIINDAQREYSFYAQNLVGEYEIKSSGTGVMQLPEDFISPIKCIDVKGHEIDIVSYRELIKHYGDFRKAQGDIVKYCCFDFDGCGYMRICPIVPQDIVIGKILYTRYAKSNIIETLNTEAIKEHALFQMKFASQQGDYSKHYNNFIRLVDEENRSNNTLNMKKKSVRGVYY